jgi:hypothetical protein
VTVRFYILGNAVTRGLPKVGGKGKWEIGSMSWGQERVRTFPVTCGRGYCFRRQKVSR